MELTPEQEETRKKLLEEERKMRAKQPVPWTKAKYRKYANYLNRKMEFFKEHGKKELTRKELDEIKRKARRDNDWLE